MTGGEDSILRTAMAIGLVGSLSDLSRVRR